jgi:hypothetical protein
MDVAMPIFSQVPEPISLAWLGFGAALETTCEADAVDVTRAAGARAARRPHCFPCVVVDVCVVTHAEERARALSYR